MRTDQIVAHFQGGPLNGAMRTLLGDLRAFEVYETPEAHYFTTSDLEAPNEPVAIRTHIYLRSDRIGDPDRIGARAYIFQYRGYDG